MLTLLQNGGNRVSKEFSVGGCHRTPSSKNLDLCQASIG